MAAVELTDADALGLAVDLLAVPLFEEDLASGGRLGPLDAALDGHLFSAAAEDGFTGKAGQVLQVFTLGKLPARRLALLGLGPRAKGIEAAAHGGEPLRMAMGKAGRAARAAGLARLGAWLPPELDAKVAARAAVEGALLGAYRFERYRARAEAKPPLGAVVVVASGDAAASEEVRAEARLGSSVAGAVSFARDLVNEAPVHCTPARLAEAAEALAKEAGLRCEVHGRKEIEALGMGMFAGVTRGSAEKPKLVKLSWEPRGARGHGHGAGRGRGKAAHSAGPRPLVLVGKAITFDSGGLSLKPADSMVTMNTDMAGSAAVLAAMRVVAELRPPFPVCALFGACENMPGGRAYKPSDVLTAYDGTTVEITNTDAEGRLVLGDVLAWAVDTLQPAGIVDVATLTGACIVALGHTTAGAFGPDGPMIDRVLAAARAAGEDVWRLPLTPSVKETLESAVADLRNAGERPGAAIAAAHFLHRFVGETPWAHLDIAGPSRSAKERGYRTKGGTGVAVRTLVELVRGWGALTFTASPELPATRRRAPRAGAA